MIIREDVEHTYFSGPNHNQEKTSLRCELKCDNPECGKTFYKKKSYTKSKYKKHYCSSKCQRTHSGICKIDGCEEKFFNRSSNKHGMCTKHRYESFTLYHNTKSRTKKRHELLELMGGACVCCDERDPIFLQVDHVFNDGHKDRKKYNGGSISTAILLKIWNETPERLQLLCSNCNHAKMRNGGVLYRPEKFTRRKVQREKIGECTC